MWRRFWANQSKIFRVIVSSVWTTFHEAYVTVFVCDYNWGTLNKPNVRCYVPAFTSFIIYSCAFQISTRLLWKRPIPAVTKWSINVFTLLPLLLQRRVTSWGSSQDAGLQPRQLRAKKVLSEGVYLWGGGAGAVSWHHAASQGDDGQISCPDGCGTGVRSWDGELTVVDSLDNIAALWCCVSFCTIA